MVYETVRNAMGLLLPVVFVLYVPMRELLGLWLPQYKESLNYLVLLLPLCTFDGKMQLLCNTYFKVLRKETLLLKYNCIAFVLSLVLSLVGGYIVGNIYFIVMSLVLAIAVRSIISEIYLARVFEIKVSGSIVQEVLIVLIFWIAVWYLHSGSAFVAITLSYLAYLLINYKNVKKIILALRTFR